MSEPKLARKPGEAAVPVAQETFDMTAMRNMAEKMKELQQFMKEELREKTDWIYSHDLFKREAPREKEDWKAVMLDPGVAKIMNFMQMRPRHRILEKEIDTKTMSLRYVIAVEIVPYLPVMYYNPVEKRMEQVFPVVAEGVASATTREKRYKVRFEWMKERDLRVEGWTDEELKKYAEEHPDMYKAKADPKYDNLYFMPTAESLGLDNTLLKMAAKRCLGSTTPLLVKTGRHICRTNASNLYDIYNASSDPVYLPGRNGEWRMITGMIREENRLVLSIKLRSGESLRSTEGHEFPISEGKLKFVRELNVGDKLVRSRIVIPTLEGGGADPRYGWAVGLFIAEGEFQADGKAVRFTLHEKETDYIDKLEMIVQPLGGVIQVHPKGNLRCVSVNIYGQAFAGLMSQFVNGDSCYTKTLSKFAWEQGEDFLHEVLQGYLDGDSWESHRRKTPKWPLGFTGENYELQHDLRCLCAILNKRVKIIRNRAKIKDHVYSAFRGWITDTIDSYNQAELEEIESIEAETKTAVVYDIDVDGDNIFLLASGIESHNSEMDAVFQLPGVAGRFSQEADLKGDRGEIPLSAPKGEPAHETPKAAPQTPPAEIPTAPERPNLKSIDVTTSFEQVIAEIQAANKGLSRAQILVKIAEEKAKAAGILTDEAAAHLVASSLTLPPGASDTMENAKAIIELLKDVQKEARPIIVAAATMTNYSVEEILKMVKDEKTRAEGNLTDEGAAHIVYQNLAKAKTQGGFKASSELPVMPPDFKLSEEASWIADYVVENFDQRLETVRSMIYGEMSKAAGLLTDVAAAKLIQGSFEERSKPPEETVTGRDAVVEALEKAGCDAERVNITEDGEEVQPKKFLADNWGKYNDTLRELGYTWIKDAKNSRWVLQGA